MAWNASNPSNDELLSNFPAQCRANWDALALGTDASLQITNAKVSSSAAIADTKLAQITTPSKVSGASITSLTSVPSGAGVLPDANSNGKLKADSGDTTPQYLDSLIDTGMFQISAGDLLQVKDGGIDGIKLSGLANISAGAGSIPVANIPTCTVTKGGTNKTSWTQYAIPYLSASTTFSEVAIGSAGQALKVNGSANGYEFGDISTVTADSDTDSGTAFGTEVLFLSKAKTITSGHTVLLVASGYFSLDGSTLDDVLFQLKHGTTVVHSVYQVGEGTNKRCSWACCALVTGLSGSVTFSVGAQNVTSSGRTGVAYGNLNILEF